MPLEFHCTGCAKLLRTPDESAGKKAKCPQCGAIVDVPLESTSADSAAIAPTIPAAPSPVVPSPRAAPDPVVNPYAAPATSTPFETTTAAKGELRHTVVGFDDILRETWEFFKANLGELAVFGVVLFAINGALQVFGQGIGAAVNATHDEVLITIFTAVNILVGFTVQAYLSLGSAIYCLRMARTRDATLNDMASAGRFYLKGIGFSLILGTITGLIYVVCLIPALATIPLGEPAVSIALGVVGLIVAVACATIIWLRYTLGFYFLVDRDSSVAEAFKQSARFMQGNKLTAFVLMLVMGIAGLLGVCACCLGTILTTPFSYLLLAVFYLTATGQTWLGAPGASGQSS